MMNGVRFVDVKKVTEPDGSLIVMEENSPIEFPIKRIFLVRDVTEGASRGDHATKETRLILFPVSGSCNVTVDNGTEKEVYHMDNPARGIFVDKMIWRSMSEFTPDCVMMAVCDRPFTPGNETYDNYDEYLNAIKMGEL